VFVSNAFVPSVSPIAREFETTGAVIKCVSLSLFLTKEIIEWWNDSLAVSLSILTSALGMMFWARYSGFCASSTPSNQIAHLQITFRWASNCVSVHEPHTSSWLPWCRASTERARAHGVPRPTSFRRQRRFRRRRRSHRRCLPSGRAWPRDGHLLRCKSYRSLSSSNTPTDAQI
jgi:hypothetical protein